MIYSRMGAGSTRAVSRPSRVTSARWSTKPIWISYSLLFAEEEVQGPAGADRIEQGRESRGWGPGGRGAPAAPERVPRGQPAADLPHRHRPGHRAGAAG